MIGVKKKKKKKKFKLIYGTYVSNFTSPETKRMEN